MGKVYSYFARSKNKTPKDAYTDKTIPVKFTLDEKNYEIYFTKKRANKYSIIHCVNNTVEWEQFPVLPRVAGRYHGIREPIISLAPSEDCIKILVIKGKPNSITGLDDGNFRSIHRYDERFINVMSEARFKEI